MHDNATWTGSDTVGVKVSQKGRSEADRAGFGPALSVETVVLPERETPKSLSQIVYDLAVSFATTHPQGPRPFSSADRRGSATANDCGRTATGCADSYSQGAELPGLRAADGGRRTAEAVKGPRRLRLGRTTAEPQ